MADTKTSALTALTGTGVDATADVLPIVDTSVTTTKKITVEELATALKSGSNWITLGTLSTTTGGTSLGFTSIPAGVRSIKMFLNGVSWNGSAAPIVQIGDSGGYENTGYVGGVSTATTGSASGFTSGTDGIGSGSGWAASSSFSGVYTLSLINAATFTWAWELQLYESSVPYQISGSGIKSLSAELDRIQLTTVAGTATIDVNGGVNISYMR